MANLLNIPPVVLYIIVILILVAVFSSHLLIRLRLVLLQLGWIRLASYVCLFDLWTVDDAFLIAVEHNYYQTVRKLRKVVNSKAIRDAVKLASEYGHLDILQLLCRNSELIRLALCRGAYHDQIPCLLMFVESASQAVLNQAYLEAARGNSRDSLYLLHNKGANCHNEALLENIRKGDGGLVISLLEWGANNYNHCLLEATKANNHNAMILLHNAGANNINDCFLAAIERNDYLAIDQLVSWGANDLVGGMSKAASVNNTDLMFKLREISVPCDLQTALSRATINNCVEARELLLDWGAQIDDCRGLCSF